jgi:iron-sulfur cluster repair di-iron protein
MTTTTSHPASNPSVPEARTDLRAAMDIEGTEMLSALNELLEAERAGARVAMETGRSISAPDLAALVDDIHKDEVRWCSMLMRAIKTLGATPSSATGAFYGKAMAIADLDDRLKFLNRGQAWVVRKLQVLIPRITDPSARAELNGMLQAHHHNIGRVEARYAPGLPTEAIAAAQPLEPPAPSEPSALIDHILTRFHEVHRQQLPELIRLATAVESAHAGHAAAPHGLAALLKSMHAELLQHMEKEEDILFPMLRRGGNPFVVHPIGVMRTEHDEHAERLADLMALAGDATPPVDACTTWRQLCTGIWLFADDLQRHIQLENDVLFPQFEPDHR